MIRNQQAGGSSPLVGIQPAARLDVVRPGRGMIGLGPILRAIPDPLDQNGKRGKGIEMRIPLSVLALVAFLASAPAAHAMFVAVDGFVIFDGGLGDLDNTVNNQITFDSTNTSNGFTTNSGFDAKGKVEISNVAGALAGQLNTGQALVLTNFIADIPAAGTPGPFNLIFEHTFGPPIPGGGTAADTIVAFANDGTGEPPYQTGGGAVPLLAGEDTIDSWQGYVDGVPIPNPTIPSPPLGNIAGLNTPYQVFGHATINPLFGGLIFTPTLRGELTFSLGGSRNQFILLTSAEVGLEDLGPLPIPALPATALALLAAALLLAATWHRVQPRAS